MKSLVIGMGIGQLYKTVLEQLGSTVVTVDSDPSKKAQYLSVDIAILVEGPFDTAHICTPNFTHFSLAGQVAKHSKIVFVDKPGVTDSHSWNMLVSGFPDTRFMMVKNNMWRSNISDLQSKATKAKVVNIKWIRRNCIPSPGSWFTTKKLAFGGVSRDLMPHLLSLYVAMNSEWMDEAVSGQTALMCWMLKDIESTDYGVINPNGTYDVDDLCVINFGTKWKLEANWRSMIEEDSSIEFIMPDDSVERFELGWCPEEAYYNMIKETLEQINNKKYWLDQCEIDSWIHKQIQGL